MNNTARDTAAELPEAMLKEATIWQARLRDAGPDTGEGREIRAAFNAWLAADARHRQAYAEMESLWGALEAPVAQILAEQPPADTAVEAAAPSPGRWPGRSPIAHALPPLAMAACLVLVLFTVIGWQQDWITQWQSDYLTAVGEDASILMDDNSRITLNTDSALAVNYNAEQRRVRLLKGEAWFDVASDVSRPFIVETAQGVVRVTGTQFNVRLEEDAAIVSLDEGRVALRVPGTPENAPVRLAPGQQAMLSPQGVSAPVTFDRTAVTAWLRGQFVFYNTPLAEVVDTLNRHRQGRILIARQELNTLKVSGIFSTDDPDAALDVITNTLPIRQIRLTDYLVLLR